MRALGIRAMRAEDRLQRDPAPSRWHYRWQRLMLTPLFRLGLRVGLPFAIAAGGASLWLGQESNRMMIVGHWQELRAAIEQRPEFQVTDLQISGASPALELAARDLLDLSFPISSWDLDLPAMRRDLADLSAVRDVRVAIEADGTLGIHLEERRPVALWRYGESLRLIDTDGEMTGLVESRSDRSDLPLIAGDGARDHIDEALALFAAAGPVAERVRGLVRMGERRWDMVLDRDQRILLPEQSPVAALERVLAWHGAEEVLDRDVLAVDMRDAARPTLRVSETAMTVMMNTRANRADEGQRGG